MSKDYARKPAVSRRQPPSQKSFPLPVFFSGMAVGALLTFIVPALFNSGSQEPSIAEQRQAAMQESKKGLKFDFYTLLKETEIIVPDVPVEQLREQEAATENYIYLLQVGSFKNSADADSLRASLIMLNLNAEIQSVSQGKNDIWHRVIVGPFEDTSKMSAARNKLASNNIDSLLLKRKP